MRTEAAELVELQGDRPQSHLIYATSLLLSEQASQALEELDSTAVMLGGRETAWLLTLRGLCHARQRNFGQAVEAYRAAIAQDDSHAVAHFAWGKSLAYMGDYGHALEHANVVVDLLPRSHEAYTFRGECYDNLARYGEAHKDYATAIDYGGNQMVLLGKQGWAALNAQRQLEEAEAASAAQPDASAQPTSTAPAEQEIQLPEQPTTAPSAPGFLEQILRGLENAGADRKNGDLPVP
jgi:tetratricopeptide (TPR) repeat protein